MATPKKKGKQKSADLEAFEDVFEKRTRRFSAFDMLGIDSKDCPPTDRDVDGTHLPTEEGVGGTSLPGGGIHTRVVVSSPDLKNTTTLEYTTHMGVGNAHNVSELSSLEGEITPPNLSINMHNVLAANQLKSQMGQKARQVLAYLNRIRSIEYPAYTVPVGYTQISESADVHAHYLRRNVLPKLAMFGLIGIAHKSLQGTTYRLHHDSVFLQLVAGEKTDIAEMTTPERLAPQVDPLAEREGALPAWIDQEDWGRLDPEVVRQLVHKAGSESQAQEKLDMIIFNESHGPEERRIRDRRAVLAHYLRTPYADIWPNDETYETPAIKQARLERERALEEKARP